MLFQDLGSRKVEADFSGGYLSNDGGVLLVRQLDHGLGLTRRLARAFIDRRAPSACEGLATYKPPICDLQATRKLQPKRFRLPQ
jgi:hypothetical protein